MRILTLLAVLLACACGPRVEPPPRERVVHLLNRATFGPTPALVEEVTRQGIEAWLGGQLQPAEEPALKPLLEGFPFYGRTMLGLYQEIYRRSPPEDPARPDGRRNLQLPPIRHQMIRQRLLRAVHSHYQLREVLTDFWFNHFYVDFAKSEVTALGVPSHEEALRRHALGRFRDLLEVSARSPAMLDYLDNASSSGTRRGGLNENYGRELLELHTMGLEAGYTQADVEAVARCFTGWSVTDDRGTGDEGLAAKRLWSFRFSEEDHDPARKRVLGLEIPARGGESDGERVLDHLARHPATARFIGRKLAVRLVGEDVPETTVDLAARTFQESDGDIARVVEAILTSEEFYRPEHRGTRYKTPLEFVASAMRLHPPPEDLAADLRNPHWEEFEPPAPPAPMTQTVPAWETFMEAFEALGSPYGCKAPTGWPDRNRVWMSTSGLYYRMEIARLLAGGETLMSPEFQYR